MKRFLLLSLLIIFPNYLFASDYIANIVSFSNIETVIHIIYFGLLSFISYIFYDVLGPETVFLFTSVVLIVLMMIKKTLLFQFDKYFEPIYKSPLNNIFTKYIIFLVLLHTLLAPVEINSFKLKQEKVASTLNKMILSSDKVTYENDTTFLISNIIKDFSTNTLGHEIKARGPLILVAPIMAYQRFIYGIPQLESINNGDLFMGDTDDSFYLVSLLNNLNENFKFKSEMRKSTADFTYLFKSYLDFLPEATQNIATNKLLYSIGYDKINKFMEKYTLNKSIYNIYHPIVNSEDKYSFYSIDSPVFEEYISQESKNLLLLLTQYKIQIKNNYFDYMYNILKDSDVIPSLLTNNSNLARQFSLDFLLNTFSFTKTFKSIKDYTICDTCDKDFFNTIEKKSNDSISFSETFKNMLEYEDGTIDNLTPNQMYAIKYYLLNLFFEDDVNSNDLIAKITTEKELNDSSGIKKLINYGFDALKIKIDFDKRKSNFKTSTMQVNSSFDIDIEHFSDIFFNIENIDANYYEKVKLNKELSLSIKEKLENKWEQLSTDKKNENITEYKKILQELSSDNQNLKKLDKTINDFLKKTMKLSIKKILENKKELNAELKVYQIIDYIVSIQKKKSVRISQIKDLKKANAPIKLGFSNFAYVSGAENSYQELKMSASDENKKFYEKSANTDYQLVYNSSNNEVEDFYSDTSMYNLRKILKEDGKYPINKYIVSKIKMNSDPDYKVKFNLNSNDYKNILKDNDINIFKEKYFSKTNNEVKGRKKELFYDKAYYDNYIQNFQISKELPESIRTSMYNERFKVFNMFSKSNDKIKKEMNNNLEPLKKIEDAQELCLSALNNKNENVIIDDNIFLNDQNVKNCDYANNLIIISKNKLFKMHEFYIQEDNNNRNKLNKFLNIKMMEYSEAKRKENEQKKRNFFSIQNDYNKDIDDFKPLTVIEEEYKNFDPKKDISEEGVFEPTLITGLTKLITYLSGTLLVSLDNVYPDLTFSEKINISLFAYYLYGPKIEIGAFGLITVNLRTLAASYLVINNSIDVADKVGDITEQKQTNSYFQKKSGDKNNMTNTALNTDEAPIGFGSLMESIKNKLNDLFIYVLNFFSMLVLLFIYLFFVIYVIYIFFRLIFVFYFKYFIKLFELFFSFIKSFKIFIVSDIEELKKELEHLFDNIKDFFIFNLMFVFLIMGLLFIKTIIYYVTSYMNNSMDLTGSSETILLSIVASIVMIILLKGLNHIIFTLLLDSETGNGPTIGSYTNAINSSVANTRNTFKRTSSKEKDELTESTNELNKSIIEMIKEMKNNKKKEKKYNGNDRNNMTNAGEVGS